MLLCMALLMFEVWEGSGGQLAQGSYVGAGVGGYLAPDSEVALL